MNHEGLPFDFEGKLARVAHLFSEIGARDAIGPVNSHSSLAAAFKSLQNDCHELTSRALRFNRQVMDFRVRVQELVNLLDYRVKLARKSSLEYGDTLRKLKPIAKDATDAMKIDYLMDLLGIHVAAFVGLADAYNNEPVTRNPP